MPEPAIHPDLPAIDRYLHGEMSGIEATAFEHRLGQDAALAREFKTQRRLLGVLRTGFVPPPPPATIPLPGNAAPPVIPPASLLGGKLVTMWLAVAVVAAGVISTGAYFWYQRSSALSRPSRIEDAYAAAAASKFEPTFVVCEPDDLGTTLSAKLAKPIQISAREGVKYRGIRTDVGGSPLAIGVVAEVGGVHVVLVFDRAAHNTPDHPTTTTTTSAGPALYRHELVHSGVLVVELSPSNRPLVLDAVVIH